ncbi:MAG TPA: hypothetical protein VGU66_02680 [Candidatus Elarobacter sp.]|nr:hypothetical protein [Candidatus Elarobacter sp.]
MTYRRKALFTLIEIAQKMLAGQIGPIEGSRKISRLRFDVEDEENDVFSPFIGIDSESDDVVVGNRALWAEAFLNDIDRRYKVYNRALRPGIADDCRALLAVFLPRLLECPVCGFMGSDQRYDAAGIPFYETCRCCGMEFGLTDVVEYDAAEWRRRWIRDGMPFRHPPPPPGWDPEAQMRAAKLA